MRRGFRTALRVGVVLGGLALGLASAEAALRFLYPMGAYPVDGYMTMAHAVGIEVMSPRLDRLRPSASGEWAPVRLVANAHGFRTRPFAPRRPGVRRVVVIGDSFMGGWEVEADDVFAARLERLLGDRVEVFNLGLGSQGPREYLTLLEEVALPLEPDLILLSVFTGNDVRAVKEHVPLTDLRSRLMHRIRIVSFLRHVGLGPEWSVGRPLDPGGAPVTPYRRRFPGPAVLNYWADRSLKAAARLTGETALPAETFLCDRAEAIQIDLMHLSSLEDDTHPAWSPTRSYLGRSIEAARRAGVPLLALVVPVVRQVHASARAEVGDAFGPEVARIYEGDTVGEKIRKYFEDAGVPAVNLLPDFRRRDAAGERLYWRFDGHWTPAGHAAAAAAAVPAVRRLLEAA